MLLQLSCARIACAGDFDWMCTAAPTKFVHSSHRRQPVHSPPSDEFIEPHTCLLSILARFTAAWYVAEPDDALDKVALDNAALASRATILHASKDIHSNEAFILLVGVHT